MVARSLQATDIPFCVIETPLQVPSARCRFEFEAVTSRVPLYTITVICLPSGELYRAFVLFGYEFFEGQYVVGQMPWELSRWPNGHEVFLGLLDEAWALTSFIFKALKPVFRGPIVHMPRAVDDTPPDPAYTRADFGLPSEKYIFNFTYDGLSTSARKNPLTVLHAFQMAFPPSVTDVLLVFKSMNSIYDPFHYEILRVISGDTRIISIDETFPKEKLLALTKSCDVFVSLHRAEGFGLSIAEAMLLAKPVIVSDYSGNQDFCSTETAFLVDGEEVSVPKGAYFFSDGQRWFSPNIATAARLMRLCYENRHEAALCALQGQSFIRNHYSIKNIARNYVRRFNELIDYNFS